MAINKTATGKFQVDIRTDGHNGKRVRKTFKTQAEAKKFQNHVLHLVDSGEEWNPKARDIRRLSDLVHKWHELQGHTLKDSKYRYSRTLGVCERLGDPLASQFTGSDFAKYRAARMADGIAANTVNHEHSYLRAVFNELIRLGELEIENPLAKVRQVKVDETELAFLDLDQIRALLAALGSQEFPDGLLIAKICLATGARWGEAEGLKASQVANNKITFIGTKSGKNRSIPIPKTLTAELKAHCSIGAMFKYSRRPWRNALKLANIELPTGQSTHVLRHTFASHFMMNGGNILTLQRILGHASITMTMRYSHLAPEHLNEALDKSPLSQI